MTGFGIRMNAGSEGESEDKDEAKAVDLLNGVKREISRNGEHSRSCRFGWKHKFSLCHVAFQVTMSQPSRNVRQAARNEELDGRRVSEVCHQPHQHFKVRVKHSPKMQPQPHPNPTPIKGAKPGSLQAGSISGSLKWEVALADACSLPVPFQQLQ